MGPTFRSWGRGAALLALAGAGAPAADGTLEAQIQSPSGQLVYAVYEGQETAASAFAGVRDALAADHTAAYAVVAKDLSGQLAVQERVGGNLGRSVLLGGLAALLGPGGGQGEGGNTAADSLRAALAPGSSAILALVDMGRMDAVTALLEPTGPRVLGVTVVGATAPPASAEGQGIARAHRR